MKRYTVGSVTGSKIDGSSPAMGGGTKPLPTLWYVHDSAFCFEIVAGPKNGEMGKREMRDLAKQLNARQP